VTARDPIAAALAIRPATLDDAPALRALRNHYIASSHATLDERPLTIEAVEAWMLGFADTGRAASWASSAASRTARTRRSG
jgi:L-amino acid N-acyltransferase YncA